MKKREPWGAMMVFFLHKYRFTVIFLQFHACSFLGLCVLGVTEGPKRPLKHLKDHLERSLRPIQATQEAPVPFWTKQKKTRSLSNFK